MILIPVFNTITTNNIKCGIIMRIPTLIIGYIFLSFFAVYPSFADTVSEATCSAYNADEEQCNKTAGCYYVQVEGESARCAQAPVGKYTTGDGTGVLYACTGMPAAASWNNANMGNTTNDCYWIESISYGEIYYAKRSGSDLTFEKVKCSAGMKAAKQGQYLVSYTGDTGLLGWQTSCRECTDDDDDCNVWTVFLDEDTYNSIGNYVDENELMNLYDRVNAPSFNGNPVLDPFFKTTTNIQNDLLVGKQIYDDSGYGIYDNGSCPKGLEFGVECKIFTYHKILATIGSGARTTYYTMTKTIDMDMSYNSYHEQVYAEFDISLNGESLILCGPVCKKECTQGYYCNGTPYRNPCPNGLTTETAGADSSAKCGINSTTWFKDSKGKFQLPISGFIGTKW